MILKLGIVVLLLLEVVYIVAVWRVASYLCMNHKWLILIPIVQLVYFAAISDHINTEIHETFTALKYVVISLLLVVGIGCVLFKFFHYDYTELAGRLMISIGTVFCLLFLTYAYINIIVNSTEHSIAMCLSSLLIPFPIVLLVASFMFSDYMEETILLYLEQ